MQLFMLDMGNRKYGDATLCRVGDKIILVDGGHGGDHLKVEGGPSSIPEQLEAILGHRPPFQLDLLVVTHCHSDHIGCLPELVSGGIISVRWALVADDRLGFGLEQGKQVGVIPQHPPQRLAAAMHEEPLPQTATDPEIQSLIDAAALLSSRYSTMLSSLASSGTTVVRYGRDPTDALERQFSDIGLELFGPSEDQLLICADRIGKARSNDVRRFRRRLTTDATRTEVALYREARAPAAVDDMTGVDGGAPAAVNNQSIILKIGAGAEAVLLTGDMQFAQPGVTHLNGPMQVLREAIAAAGPYGFVRLPHHGATNGTDAALLDSLPRTTRFGISTGSGDEGHPAPEVLGLLNERSLSVAWARTDRNGMVRVDLRNQTDPWSVARGALCEADGNTPFTVEPSASTEGPSAASGKRRRAYSPLHRPGRPGSAGGSETSGPNDKLLAGGRPLPDLIFVTRLPLLRANIGGPAAQAAVDMITAAGQKLLDYDTGAVTPDAVTQAAQGAKGIVLLGGYDVIPGQAVDALPPRLRRQLNTQNKDDDQHIVWSDDSYGGLLSAGEGLLPVSRIPDARDGNMLLSALRSAPPNGPSRFGIRNHARPFATGVFQLVPGSGRMIVSAPGSSASLRPLQLTAAQVYLMLHGSADDSSAFWGETAAGDYFEAVHLRNVPNRTDGFVFSGCCYGALTIRDLAVDGTPPTEWRFLEASNSLALAFLKSGASAFVGCTGTHYSPVKSPYQTASGPFHRAFWHAVSAGLPPAPALLKAKIDYISGMPYTNSPGARAIEFKTWRQFTCLGLGW